MNSQQESTVDSFKDRFMQLVGVQFTQAELDQLLLGEQLVDPKLVRKLMDLLVIAIDESIEFNRDTSSHMNEINRMRDDFEKIQKISEANIEISG